MASVPIEDYIPGARPQASPVIVEASHALLVVDDHEAVIASVEELFRGHYQVLGARNVADALAIIRQGQVAVVMADQRMPGVSGSELLAHVALLEPDVTRILMTAYADLDEYALLHQAARWARGLDIFRDGEDQPLPGDGRVPESIADGWRAILLRQPTWRSEAEVRAGYESGEPPRDAVATLGEAEPGHVAIDLAVIDARPADATATDRLLALEGQDGRPMSLAAALASLPAYWMVGRRYRKRP